jgi:hypothetical protein
MKLEKSMDLTYRTNGVKMYTDRQKIKWETKKEIWRNSGAKRWLISFKYQHFKIILKLRCKNSKRFDVRYYQYMKYENCKTEADM